MPYSHIRKSKGVEEKGQRNSRSLEPYISKRGLPEGTACRGCGIIYHNKRWQVETQGVQRSGETLCPACQRMEAHNPAGVVTLSGPYLAEHKSEILNTISQEEAKHRQKNPLGRIMEISEDHGEITVTTTEDKLAQKLGREVFKSQRGELHYKWSHELRMVRVEWQR